MSKLDSKNDTCFESVLINLANAIKTRGIDTVNSVLVNVSNMDNYYVIDYAVELIKNEYKIDFFDYDNIRKRGDYACARGLLIFIIKTYLKISLQKIADEFPRGTKRASINNALKQYEYELESPVKSNRIRHNEIKARVLSKIEESLLNR